MSKPEKYSHIDFTPPEGVRKAAESGLRMRREHGRGGTAVGIARARDLSNGKEVSPSTVRRMKAFFDRHAQNSKAEGFRPGEKGYPSNGKIADLLWGGRGPGYAWAKKVVAQMESADKKSSRSLRPFGSTFGMKPKVYVVSGPPGAGKTTYVNKHKGDNDVVFDFDAVMQALTGLPPHQHNENLVSYCTDIRNLIIKRAMRGSKMDRTWIVTTNVNDELKKTLSDVPVKYIEMDTPRDECMKRVESDPQREGVREETKKLIEDYFAKRPVDQRRAAIEAGIERRFLGSFETPGKADPELLRVEQRADPNSGKPQTWLVGYAARFGKESLLLGDFHERIDPAAFGLVEEKRDAEGKPLATRCLFNHDPNELLGRYPTTMRLFVDDKGLRYECLLPETRRDIQELVARGDLRGSSFSFIVADGGERWTMEDGKSVRLVTRVKALLDCGPVTYPAYDDATCEVVKRSYRHYQERRTVEKQATDYLAVRRKYESFLAERRNCGTGAGGFQKGNSCGGGGAANKEDSSWREGAKVGAILGTGIGAVGGAPGMAIGAALGAAAGAIVGTTGMKSQKPLEDAYKKTGTSLEKVDKAAKSLGMQMTVSTPDRGKSLVMESGDSVAVISSGSQVSKAAGVSFQYFPGSDKGGKFDIKSVEKAAKAVGAKNVAVEAWTDADVKTLESKGYKQVGRSPGGYSSSKGVFEKQLGRGKSKRSLDELRRFVADRRDCGRDEGGRFGSNNDCAGGGRPPRDKGGSGGGKSSDGSGGKSPQGSGKSSNYAEYKKDGGGNATIADLQKFVDDARKGQLERGGKSGGKSDDGGGVQTWSKGDNYPWTTKQVGDSDGYLQAQLPDGTKTQKYPFKGGDTSKAEKDLQAEIDGHKKKRSIDPKAVARDTIRYLRSRK